MVNRTQWLLSLTALSAKLLIASSLMLITIVALAPKAQAAVECGSFIDNWGVATSVIVKLKNQTGQEFGYSNRFRIRMTSQDITGRYTEEEMNKAILLKNGTRVREYDFEAGNLGGGNIVGNACDVVTRNRRGTIISRTPAWELRFYAVATAPGATSIKVADDAVAALDCLYSLDGRHGIGFTVLVSKVYDYPNGFMEFGAGYQGYHLNANPTTVLTATWKLYPVMSIIQGRKIDTGVNSPDDYARAERESYQDSEVTINGGVSSEISPSGLWPIAKWKGKTYGDQYPAGKWFRVTAEEKHEGWRLKGYTLCIGDVDSNLNPIPVSDSRYREKDFSDQQVWDMTCNIEKMKSGDYEYEWSQLDGGDPFQEYIPPIIRTANFLGPDTGGFQPAGPWYYNLYLVYEPDPPQTPEFTPWLQTTQGNVTSHKKITGQALGTGGRAGGAVDREAEFVIATVVGGSSFCSSNAYALASNQHSGNCNIGKYSINTSTNVDNPNTIASNIISNLNSSTVPTHSISVIDANFPVDSATGDISGNNALGKIWKYNLGKNDYKLTGGDYRRGRATIYVPEKDSTLTITSDIKINGTGHENGEFVPNLAIVVNGDVIIDENVSRIDATIFATGTIKTCGTNYANPATPKCQGRLEINGLLASTNEVKSFVFGRRFIEPLVRTSGVGSGVSAEQINYQGKVMLFPPPGLELSKFKGKSIIKYISGQPPRF